MIGRTILA